MNIKDIYIYNKKVIWLGIITLIVLIIGLFIYFNKDNNVNNVNNNKTEVLFKDEFDLVLFGTDVTIKQNDKYQEPGYYAILNNEIVSNQVIIDNPLDNTKPGTYIITYKFKSLTKTRKVIVLEKEKSNEDKQEIKDIVKDEPITNKNITLKLNGEKEINLKINDKYLELGAVAKDEKGNDISNKISITGSINTSVVGTYVIHYSINYNGIKKSLDRTINVLKNTTLSLSSVNNNYTNKDIIINVKADGSNFLYLKFPDNTVSKENNKDYIISENGTYTFYAYNRDNTYEKKSIIISNIDKVKPNGSCKATINNSKTTINVVANDNVGIDHYIYNGKYSSKDNNYTINSNLKNVYVDVYDKAGNVNNIICSINSITPNQTINDGNLEIHMMLTGHDDDGILIRTNNKTIMIDGGRYQNKDKVIPYLNDLGVKNIDLLIGSHVHWNHIQSHDAIIENFNVKKAIYPIDLNTCQKNKLCDSNDIKYVLNSLKKNNIPFNVVEQGEYIELGEMKLYFIGPLYKNTAHNKNSFVFILKFRNTSYMFMGDCSNSVLDTAKFQLNANKWNLNLNIDVLKWPHHGYNDLTETFFQATTPKYALVPNGGSCSSKYPSTHNKNLMKKYNTKYISTCENGNVVLISDGKYIDIKTHQKASNYKR